MEKEFEQMIKNKKLENEEWQKLVCELIKIIPENKYNRLNYIINKNNLEENLTFNEIIEILDKIVEDAEKGLYRENYYFDYRLDMDVVEGDESWIDEIDRAFRGIKGLLKQEKYEQAMKAYEHIFEITDRNYEELYTLLPEYYYIEEKLEGNIEEHYFNYLETIYYTKNIDRNQKYIEVFINHKWHYTNSNIIYEFCKKHENFRKEMINPIVEKLAQEKYGYAEGIIFHLLMAKGEIQAVMEFLKNNIKKNIYVFKLFYDYMLEKEKYQELLENLYILENVEMDLSQKEQIYEKIIKVADIIKDENIKDKYLYKINELNPCLKYTLQICKNFSLDKKIEQIEKLNEKFIVKKDNQDEKILIELILGKVEKVYTIYEKMEKYEKQEVENLIIYYLLKFWNKEKRDKKLLTMELKNEIIKLDYSSEIDQILNIMDFTKKEIKKEFIESIENNFSKKIKKETQYILQIQDRARYQKIANHLVILVEHLYQEERQTQAKELLQKYQEEYKRYNAYRKCIKEELEKSSI